MSRSLIAGPATGPLVGELTPPGDKSISHRAVILAALADGATEVHGFLPGEDNLATAAMFEAMGVAIEWRDDQKTRLRIRGAGLHGLQEPSAVLDAGNSGTCARLLAGVLAGQPFFSVLTGDVSLLKRPMRRVVGPLKRMGAVIDGRRHGELLPLAIRGGTLAAIHHTSEVASAQVKSCLLLAALFADGETIVSEPRPSRDHTERMLPLFGQPLSIEDDGIHLAPRGHLTPPQAPLHIPADPSSASFFAVAATLVPGSSICLKHVGINPRRDGWRRLLRDMGADIRLHDETLLGEEPAADLRVTAARLGNIEVPVTLVADAIDEFPILFVAAALAEGEFVLRQAGELRVKESDRIAAMAAALRACGVQVEELEDGAVIHGGCRLHAAGRIDAHGDHRIAMAMAVAAQRADAEIVIDNAGAIATSFPDFVPMGQRLGMNLRWQS